MALNSALLILTLLAALGASEYSLGERADLDPQFAPIESHFLIFPMTEKDYWLWGSTGSAVFLNNKAVITPEASNRKGLIHTTQPNPKPRHWVAVMDFKIGRDKVIELHKSGDGLSIYYLRNFDSGNPDIN